MESQKATSTVTYPVLALYNDCSLIYCLLTYEPKVVSIIKVQATVKRWLAVRSYKMLMKRTIIAKEVLETEKSYVARLDVVVKVFIEPIRDQVSCSLYLAEYMFI